jgi:hypothetical protein
MPGAMGSFRKRRWNSASPVVDLTSLPEPLCAGQPLDPWRTTNAPPRLSVRDRIAVSVYPVRPSRRHVAAHRLTKPDQT